MQLFRCMPHFYENISQFLSFYLVTCCAGAVHAGAIQVLGLGCAGFAEMALCIVWIIAVQIYHGFENLSDSRCGLDAITRQYASQTPKSEKFGASFGLFVVAWLFVTTMMLLLALTPNEMMDTGSEDSNYCHGKLKCTNCGAEMVPTYSSAVSEDDSTPAHARRQISEAGSTDRGGALANLVYVRPDPTGDVQPTSLYPRVQ
eukprot:m.740966 g.740966  ORF g.740966 m.740966 type:complete len:202 (+) comp23116_c3_seq35:1231-1836(+)